MPRKGQGCFNPLRDILAAPYFPNQATVANHTYSKFNASHIPTQRLAFFAGDIRPDQLDYSGGVRQVGVSCWMVCVCVCVWVGGGWGGWRVRSGVCAIPSSAFAPAVVLAPSSNLRSPHIHHSTERGYVCNAHHRSCGRCTTPASWAQTSPSWTGCRPPLSMRPWWAAPSTAWLLMAMAGAGG
jgi:hypothetical protein